SSGPRSAAPSKAWRPQAGPTWASRPRGSRTRRRHCWRCCRRRPPGCARTAPRRRRGARATRCWSEWPRRGTGPGRWWTTRGSSRWWRVRWNRRCRRRCWRSACARAIPPRRASPPPSTRRCSGSWRNAWPPTWPDCRSAPRPRCWWWTTPGWRRWPTSGPRPSATRRAWATSTWSAPGVRRAPRSSPRPRPGPWTPAWCPRRAAWSPRRSPSAAPGPAPSTPASPARRSPGSPAQPLVYGMALDDGLVHSQSLLVDAPQSFGGYRPGNFDAGFNGPVAVADALRLSLNVPAVDLLDRVGPARFAARLEHAGIELRFPRGSRPNLALVLGGTGARLEDLVGAYAALARGGIAGRVRYTPADPPVERRLLSPGAAWIVREVLAANPRPGERADTFDTGRRPRVAWKTGTSFGFRDAWALGTTGRHTVGVWVGRPDGTPLPGQYGAVTALPRLFEVVDSLPRLPGDGARVPPPPGVERREVCWPLGIAATQTPAGACHRRF